MKKLLSTKQVARAVGVSESSVKRWCDKGDIPTQYTAGGHRRVLLADFAAFVRHGRHQVVNPEALGLPPTSGQSVRVIERAREQMTAALVAGDEQLCRQIAIDLYLAGHGLGLICDDVFAVAFRSIGEAWSCGETEVYQERRGCEITLRVLYELRSLLPTPAEDAPLAIGGAASGDPYGLGTTMCELVLRDAKWNATSLGSNLPFDTLGAAILEHRPRLFWISCSHIADEAAFLAGYGALQEKHGASVAFVVGGSALTAEIRQEMKFAAYCDNMQHLEGFARTLQGAMVG
jgi:excisionase family DNA binding protein